MLKFLKWTGITLVSLFLIISSLLYFFKDEICGIVISEINKKLKAKVTVEQVDLTFWASFPNLSIDFNEVFIQDSNEKSTKKDTLFYSERVRLRFNPMDIWNEKYDLKKIDVSPSCLFLKINEAGITNYDILKPTADTTSSQFKLKLEQVDISALRFVYNNKATNQYYKTKVHDLQLIGDFSNEQYDLQAKSNLKIQQLRSGKINLLQNKEAKFDVKLSVNQVTKTVNLPNAKVFISNLPFNINGFYKPDSLHFDIRAAKIQLTDLVNNLAIDEVNQVKKFKGSGTADFKLLIDGNNELTSPVEINCDFNIANGELIEPTKNLKVNKIQLLGKYSNKGGQELEFLNFAQLKFVTVGGPFVSQLKITQFATPRFVGNAVGALDMNILHSIFRIPLVETIGGNLKLHTDFDVKMDSNDYTINKLEGNVDFDKVLLKLKNDKRTFKNISGHAYLQKNLAGIDNLTLNLGSSDFKISGVFDNIVPFLKNKGKILANIDLTSTQINIADLGNTTKEEKISERERSYILPDFVQAEVSLHVEKLIYENHTFKHLKSKMIYNQRKFQFPALSLISASADVQGSLLIEERSPEMFQITTNVSSNNLYFKQLFTEWNNFNQDVIKEDNIYGKAQVKVLFDAPFDLRNGVVSNAIKADISIKIMDGKLKNVQQFKSITESLRTSQAAKLAIGSKNIVSLEKKLLDLQFATLENTLVIRNGVMEIPTMSIHSNALDIEAKGTHSFDNKINYGFVFRFRDLKEKETTSEFGEVIDDETGFKVFMKMYGTIDKPIIEWDSEAKKESKKESIEQEKQDIKAMLKSEFGIFKNDSTVQQFQQKEKPKEKIEMIFDDNVPTNIDPDKIEKSNKLKEKLNKLKLEAEKEKQQNVNVEFD
ncbi:MAG: AsmA-like C-terminal region-containing protein [Bacteroidota bacterium]